MLQRDQIQVRCKPNYILGQATKGYWWGTQNKNKWKVIYININESYKKKIDHMLCTQPGPSRQT